MIVYDESSSSSSGSEDEYVEKAVAESNGNPDAVEGAEGDVNADGGERYLRREEFFLYMLMHKILICLY